VAYIGTQPLAGQYRKLDDISSGFNGATLTFTTSVGGTNVTAGSPQQLLVSLGGVIQQPTTDYTVSTSTISFTTAPASGLAFFAILMGDALNTSVPADGSITSAKLAGSLSVGLAAGTVSAPSLFFSGDANTGVYSPAADQVAVTTNGVERVEWGTSEVVFNDGGTNYDFRIEGDTNANLFFVDASADAVGIGTTSPSVLVHGAVSSGAANLRLESTANSGEAGLQLFGKNSGGTVRTATIKYDASDYFRIATASAVAIAFETSDSERARIDSSGRLLIGTSTSRTIQGVAGILQLASSSYTDIQQSSYNGAYSAFRFTRSNGAIGTNTIVSSGDNLGGIYWHGADGSSLDSFAASIHAVVDATPGANDMPGRLVFSTTADGASSPTERMRITSDGYLKVSNSGSYDGATNPQHEFTGSRTSTGPIFKIKNTNASGPRGGQIEFPAAAPNNGTEYFLYCNDNAAVRAVIYSNGGLSNYSANNANLSDRNVKKDISPAAGTWDCIKEWEIVNYRYKDQSDDADLNLGVIAQQVAESCPEVITVFSEAKDAKPAVLDDDGNEVEPAQEAQPEKLGVKEQQMYWMAIKALQEAQVRIEQLEARLTAAGIE